MIQFSSCSLSVSLNVLKVSPYVLRSVLRQQPAQPGEVVFFAAPAALLKYAQGNDAVTVPPSTAGKVAEFKINVASSLAFEK